MAFYSTTVNASKVAATLADFPSFIDPSRIGITTLAEAESSRFYADEGKVVERAREVVSENEIHCLIESLTTSAENHCDHDGIRADYAVTDTYGAKAVWVNGYVFVSHDGGGTDSTGNHTPTLNGGITAGGVAGKIGVGTDFDGSNDTIDINTIATSGVSDVKNMTMSLWANGDTMIASAVYIIGFANSGNALPLTLISRAPSTIRFFTRNDDNSSSVQLETGITMTNGQWFLVHGIVDGTTNRVYVDGSAEGTGTNSGIPTLNQFSIGNPLAISGREYNGQTDEVRVSDGVKSTNWISTEHNNQNDEATFWNDWEEAAVQNSNFFAFM